MPALRGLTVSVGRYYADLTAITLVRNMRHQTEHLVVTAPGDPVIPIARAVPGVRVLETDAGTRHGAMFNKSLMMEEGFDALGREGWILITDADVILPDVLPLHRLQPGHLHGARRRILEDVSAWRPGLDWSRLPVNHDGGTIGFFQLFSCESPCLPRIDPTAAERDYWYDPTFAHGGGGDAAFMALWPKDKRIVLNDCDVLHLGPTDYNWFGTSQDARDLMAKFVRQNGWKRAAAKHSDEAAARAGPIVERVKVPGYKASTFELPFVRRAREAAAGA